MMTAEELKAAAVSGERVSYVDRYGERYTGTLHRIWMKWENGRWLFGADLMTTYDTPCILQCKAEDLEK